MVPPLGCHSGARAQRGSPEPMITDRGCATPSGMSLGGAGCGYTDRRGIAPLRWRAPEPATGKAAWAALVLALLRLHAAAAFSDQAAPGAVAAMMTAPSAVIACLCMVAPNRFNDTTIARCLGRMRSP